MNNPTRGQSSLALLTRQYIFHAGFLWLTFLSTTEDYDYGSRSRDPARHISSAGRNPAIDSDRRQSPGRATIQTARTGSGRPPSSYYHHPHQASPPSHAPTNPDPRTGYTTQRPSSSQGPSFSYQNPVSGALYKTPPSNARSNNAPAVDDQVQDLQNLSIGGRGRDERPVNPSAAPTTNYPSIPSSAVPTSYAPNVRPQIIGPATGSPPTSESMTYRSISAAQSITRPSETTFHSSLTPTLQSFANLARDDWKSIESYVRKDDSLIAADPMMFFNEAIQAFSSGKDSYGNQCIHRAALLRLVENCSSNTALKKIKNIRDKKPEGKTLLTNYDKLLKAAKDKAKPMASNTPGPASTQRRDATQAPQDSSRAPYPPGGPGPHYVSLPSVPSPYPLSSGFPNQVDARSSGVPTATVPSGLDSWPGSGTLGPSSSGLQEINQGPLRTSVPGPQAIHDGPGGSGDTTLTGTRRASIGNLSLTGISVTDDNTFYPPRQDQLNPHYQRRHSSFYKLGTVFSVLWHSGASSDKRKNPPKGYRTAQQFRTIGKYGEEIYSTIRRMVVVRERHGYCVCIQINTYSGRGLGKIRSNPREVNNHSIVHMSDTTPTYLSDEPKTNKMPIAVKKAAPFEKLVRESRLCYSQPSTVQHNVKALHVGQVTPDCLPLLETYYNQAQQH